MKTALVMEGGGMRGMFTCGVMDVLMEQGIAFDAAAGISAGAAFGCNFKSRQIGRPFRYNQRYCADPRYQSLRSWLTTGDLFNADFCYRLLPDELDVFDRDAFRRNPMPFYAGAFDIEKGVMVYHRCADGGEEDLRWMRASASMPLLSRPVRIGDRLLLDGGVKDPTPYFFMESLGYRKNLVILTQPSAYRKGTSAGLAWLRLPLRKYPRLLDALARRPEEYNRHIARIRRRERAGEALVICPPGPLPIRRTERDPRALAEAYRIGRAEAEKRLGDIRAFYAEKTDAEKEKKRLRREAREALAALPEAYRAEADRKITAAALAWDRFAQAESVFLYVSVFREPDTRALLRAALAAGKRVYAPRCGPGGAMHAARLRSEAELIPGAFGILEPPPTAETAEPEEIGLMLIPCLSAFRDGARLGRGGGYYDRFLAAAGGMRACLCYDRLCQDAIPMAGNDQWMDALITERGIIDCRDAESAADETKNG